MGYSFRDVLLLLAEIEGLENTTRAKRNTLKQALAELAPMFPAEPEDDSKRCPRCGVTVKGKPVAEHLEDVHGIRQDVGVDEGGNK